jgi:hypothetical protein
LQLFVSDRITHFCPKYCPFLQLGWLFSEEEYLTKVASAIADSMESMSEIQEYEGSKDEQIKQKGVSIHY